MNFEEIVKSREEAIKAKFGEYQKTLADLSQAEGAKIKASSELKELRSFVDESETERLSQFAYAKETPKQAELLLMDKVRRVYSLKGDFELLTYDVTLYRIGYETRLSYGIEIRLSAQSVETHKRTFQDLSKFKKQKRKTVISKITRAIMDITPNTNESR